MTDGDGSGASLIFDRRSTSHQDDNINHNVVINQPQLRLSTDHLTVFPLNPGPETHRASKSPVKTKSMQRCMGSADLDVIREMQYESRNPFAEGNLQGDDSISTRRANLPAPFDENGALHNAISELQDGHVESIQASQLGPAVTSTHQPDLKNGRLPKQL